MLALPHLIHTLRTWHLLSLYPSHRLNNPLLLQHARNRNRHRRNGGLDGRHHLPLDVPITLSPTGLQMHHSRHDSDNLILAPLSQRAYPYSATSQARQ
jgi:hypothetical protein